MQISGSREFPTAPGSTYALLTDPEALKRAMPGLKELQAQSDTYYDAELELGVAGIKGKYKGHLELTQVVPDVGYTMVLHGEGAMGFMDATVSVALETSENGGTTLQYDGDAKVGGTVAGVGQRMLSGVAKLIIGQFFNGLQREAEALET